VAVLSTENALEEHHHYLSDENRLRAFSRAVARVVRPGDVVLDLGAGTGILGLLACRAGARRVYAVEAGGMIELARRLGEANGFADRIEYVKGLSTRIDLPERVDAIVTDQIGHFGFQAGLLEYVPDARDRFLKPDGRIIPGRVDLEVAPVEGSELYDRIAFWERGIADFDFTPLRPFSVNAPYMTKFQPEQVLGSVTTTATIDLRTADGSPVRFEANLTIAREGTLHGIGGWFRAELAPDVFMTNSPVAPDAMFRMNTYFPIERPMGVHAGDRVRVEMTIVPLEMIVSWTVTVSPHGQREVRFSHSTFQGMIVAREDVTKNRPAFVPTPSPWGAVRRTILELCDGTRTLAEIQREVARRYLNLFRSASEAAQFVAECIERYT
jgi:protein arginine N-methyltransferase 1